MRIEGLTSAGDLLQKLEHDRDRLRTNAHDVYAAFDFFLTAWHLLDWLHPDPDGKQARKQLTESEPLLQLAGHIANGAKHLVLTKWPHDVVGSVEAHRGGFDSDAFSDEAYDANAFAFDGLHVRLANGELRVLGPVADELLEFWQARIP